MSRLTCPECDGRQVDLSRGYLRECPMCLGDGRLTMVRAITRPRIARDATFAILLVAIAIASAITGLSS